MSIYTDILIEARKKIESGENSKICYAINRCAGHLEHQYQLSEWIGTLLGDNCTYIEWMRNNYPEIEKPMNSKDFRDGRLQWLDWMIANVDKEILK